MSDPVGPTTTTLLMVRHGQSTWNAEGRWQGQADPPLSDLGRQQAHAAVDHIGMVDAIASSPQDRAKTTATIIADSLGIGPVTLYDGLRERNAGPWSGLTRADIEDDYPNWLEEGRRPDGYESDESLQARVDAALRAVAADHPGGTVLVLCHGGVIHNFELSNNIEVGRVPNLSGRAIAIDAADIDNARWQVGDTIRLVDDDQLTGGDPHRI